MKAYHPTQQSAELIAEFCAKKGLKREAIEFYFHSGQRERAYDLAVQSEEVELFSGLLLAEGGADFEEHVKVANYLENSAALG